MVDRGCTWQGLLSLHLLLRHEGVGAGGKVFFDFTFFFGNGGGALGNAFSPFSFYCGTGAVGGGAKRSTSELDDHTSLCFTSLPGGEATIGLERTSNSSSLDTGSLGRAGGWRSKRPQRLPPDATFQRTTCLC